MNNAAKLIVTDKGDPSVGIWECSWIVEAPFTEKQAIEYSKSNDKDDKETLEFFRSKIVELYKEYSEGRIIAEYEFEVLKDH